MEVLAGARGDNGVLQLRRLLARTEPLVLTDEHYDLAADYYRRCRLGGETVRSQIDCLIAAVAVRRDITVLHDDRDFDVLARHTPLRATRA